MPAVLGVSIFQAQALITGVRTQPRKLSLCADPVDSWGGEERSRAEDANDKPGLSTSKRYAVGRNIKTALTRWQSPGCVEDVATEQTPYKPFTRLEKV